MRFFQQLLLSISFSVFISLLFAKCNSIDSRLPEEVRESLKLSGKNRSELKKIFKHYSSPQDSLQFKAACYLIENMRWHNSSFKKITPDPNLVHFIQIVDARYYNISKGRSIEQLESNSFKTEVEKLKIWAQDTLKKIAFKEPQIEKTDNSKQCDLNFISADFIINQIDHAFLMKNASYLIKELSFNDFCEYILPYKLVDGQYLTYSADKLFYFFNKYLGNVNKDSIPECITRYNLTLSNFHDILGDFPFEMKGTGFEELLFKHEESFFDCFHISNYGSLILNACGIPTAVESITAYKFYATRHSYCAIPPNESEYVVFSLESTIPKLKTTQFEPYTGWMNLFRVHFSAQKKAPYFLKTKGEYVPSVLSDPCIEDITSKRIQTLSLELKFHEQTDNNLAYLATFCSRPNGMVPVTWATINKGNGNVVFANVIPNRIYFPIYYKGKSPIIFGNAFYLKLDSSQANLYRIIYLNNDGSVNKKVSAIITRKYPPKGKFTTMANALPGTLLLGSSDPYFYNADTIAKLKFVPQPFLQDWDLNNKKAYKYYRIIVPHLPFQTFGLSELEWLTDKKYGYSNIMAPTPFPIKSPSELKTRINNDLAKLINPSTNRNEYLLKDKNMTTAPKDTIYTVQFEKPLVVTTLRFAPLNESNGVIAGHNYTLFYWAKNEWAEFNTQIAKYHYLSFEDLPKGKLFWLRDNTAGNEEEPFFINDRGLQVFIYETNVSFPAFRPL